MSLRDDETVPQTERENVLRGVPDADAHRYAGTTEVLAMLNIQSTSSQLQGVLTGQYQQIGSLGNYQSNYNPYYQQYYQQYYPYYVTVAPTCSDTAHVFHCPHCDKCQCGKATVKREVKKK